jgi:TolB-like protein
MWTGRWIHHFAARGGLRAGLLLLALALAVGCAHRPEIRDRRVVVMDFENTIPGPQTVPYSQALADMMTSELANYPRVAVIERQDLKNMTEDHEVRSSRWYELGRKTGADYVIVGAIARLDRNYILNARLLSVETGQIISGSSVTRYCKREDDIYPVMQAAARVMAHHIKVLAERHDALAQGPPPAAAEAPAPAPAATPAQ